MTPEHSLPQGTVTFLFTDIEGSTRLWQQFPDAMPDVIARHDALLRSAVQDHRGVVFRTVGDSVNAAFGVAADALRAALLSQSALLDEAWGNGISLRVRMALHTGAAEVRDGEYMGHTLNRVSRLLSAGHGGQILLSEATAQLLHDGLPTGVRLCDLGERRLRDLVQPERIYQVQAPGLPRDFPPLRTADAGRTSLPPQPTPFIGRTADVEAVADLLTRDTVRLLTLTGPGGTGKTRLSLEAGARLTGRFTGGIAFVPLDSVHDSRLVAPAIAAALGVPEVGSEPVEDTLRSYLRDREMLLILDNLEQVTDAAILLGDLLASCSGLTMLVTSRAVLHLSAEHEYPVAPLALPDRLNLPAAAPLLRYDAVALFVERARAVRPDFALTRDNAAAVAEICARLDGLPLAIELAASRIKLFSPQALLDRLSSSSRVLSGGARDRPGRQQTLYGAIDWSYQLLTEEEQMLFRRLGAFAGGWTFDAAEAVCNGDGSLAVDPFEGLASLVDKSLVRQADSSGETADESRFSMLGTIRDFALQRLEEAGESDSVKGQHARYYLDWATQYVDHPVLGNVSRGMRMATREMDNLRTALTWSRDRGEVDLFLRLVGTVGPLWFLRGFWREGRTWLEPAVTLATAERRELSARALAIAGMLASAQGDYETAVSWLEQSIAMWREVGGSGRRAALDALGVIRIAQGDLAGARPLLEDALVAVEEGTIWTPYQLVQLALLERNEGNVSAARSHLEEALAFARGHEEDGYVALALNSLGDLDRLEGEYDRAEDRYEEALARVTHIGITMARPGMIHNLAHVAHARGDDTKARELFREALDLFEEMGDRRGMAECVAGLACLHAGSDPREMARLFGAASAAVREMGVALSGSNQADYDRAIAEARSHLGAEFDEAVREGESISLAEAVRTVRDTWT